jgi:hypothetical protein
VKLLYYLDQVKVMMEENDEDNGLKNCMFN